VIYCVVPPGLEDELFDRLVEYYRENPDVTVIVDRRRGPDGRSSTDGTADVRPVVRDRRRPRIPGTFPRIEAP
jgi:hypothetical protein